MSYHKGYMMSMEVRGCRSSCLGNDTAAVTGGLSTSLVVFWDARVFRTGEGGGVGGEGEEGEGVHFNRDCCGVGRGL